MKVFDYHCPQCNRTYPDQLVTAEEEDTAFCGECSTAEHNVPLEKLLGAPKQFTTIVPTYPGSKKKKAGYQHLHVNRPATRTQVGVGGGISQGDN